MGLDTAEPEGEGHAGFEPLVEELNPDREISDPGAERLEGEEGVLHPGGGDLVLGELLELEFHFFCEDNQALDGFSEFPNAASEVVGESVVADDLLGQDGIHALIVGAGKALYHLIQGDWLWE
jgi:hypothetical protein